MSHMDRLIRERRWFLAAFAPPADPNPYDVSQPFDAQKLLEGFTEQRREVPVDPDSILGKTMAAAREAWAAPGYVPIDPETFTVEPNPVADFDDE